MKEVWKNIEEYLNYQVSNLGRVRSLNYNGTKETKVLTPGKCRNGYLKILLYKDGIRETRLIHRLVAKVFILNIENKSHVNHKDGNKQNNCVDNLEWCSQSENVKHAIKKGLGHKPRYKVAQYDMYGNYIKLWGNVKEITKALNIPQHYISKCANGVLKTSHGYIWRYVNAKI